MQFSHEWWWWYSILYFWRHLTSLLSVSHSSIFIYRFPFLNIPFYFYPFPFSSILSLFLSYIFIPSHCKQLHMRSSRVLTSFGWSFKMQTSMLVFVRGQAVVWLVVQCFGASRNSNRPLKETVIRKIIINFDARLGMDTCWWTGTVADCRPRVIE